MHVALVAALAMLAAPVAPAPADGHDPCWQETSVAPAQGLGASVERGTCDGASWSVALSDPAGRSDVRWYDDARGVGLEAHRAPRFVAWWQDDEGCHLIVYAAGAAEPGCFAGTPPSPALLP